MKTMFTQIRIGLIGLLSFIISEDTLNAKSDPLSAEAAFNFIDSQVMPIKDHNGVITDNYFAQNTTHVEMNEKHGFRKLRAHLYTNALAAIALTHKGLKDENSDHLEKAAGIFKTFNRHQYTEDGNYPHLAGAFPNQLISEDYNTNPGATEPYTVEEDSRIVRHGNNAWYLMALGYYTLRTGDRQFVPALEKLADYFSSERAQEKQKEDSKYGAILFGWGNCNSWESLNKQKTNVATEHQAEAFAGLVYAAEVMRTENRGANKSWQYLKSAHQILGFAKRTLYNGNNQHPSTHIEDSFFHTGADQYGIPVAYHPSLDAQTCAYLAFAQPLQGIVDISDALDYSWKHMYGENVDVEDARGVDSVFAQTNTREPVKGQGALWYQGDQGIWLSGSAQLSLSYKYAHHLTGDPEDLKRSNSIFNDMSELVWLKDSTTHGNRTIEWPEGGFPSFSDHYYANTEPDSVGVAEKLPSLEPTVWRYFDMNNINPYFVRLTNSLPAPDNFALTKRISGTLLTWEPHPLAVSYVVMRNDKKEPIAHISNLGYKGNPIRFLDKDPSNSESFYVIVPRDLAGQEGKSCFVSPIAHYAFNGTQQEEVRSLN